MKLKHKLAIDFVASEFCPDCECVHCKSEIFLAGFERARGLAQAIARDERFNPYYTGHDSYILEGIVGCSQVLEETIRNLGEGEIG